MFYKRLESVWELIYPYYSSARHKNPKVYIFMNIKEVKDKKKQKKHSCPLTAHTNSAFAVWLLIVSLLKAFVLSLHWYFIP